MNKIIRLLPIMLMMMKIRMTVILTRVTAANNYWHLTTGQDLSFYN
jgi:hypothetical protein